MTAHSTRSAFQRIESAVYSANTRTAYAARGALCVLAALIAALAVMILGPLYAPAAFVVLIGGLLMLRDIRWGFLALFAVIGFLPFAALPFKHRLHAHLPRRGPAGGLLRVDHARGHAARPRADRHRARPAGAAVPADGRLLVRQRAALQPPDLHRIRNFAELVLAIGFFFVLVNTLRRRADLDFWPG